LTFGGQRERASAQTQVPVKQLLDKSFWKMKFFIFFSPSFFLTESFVSFFLFVFFFFSSRFKETQNVSSITFRKTR